MTATLTEPAVFSPRLRALSAGMVALSTLVAFEYLAVATAMPVVGRELDGYHLYGLAFSGGLAAGVIATVAGGRWSDVKGPRAPLWTGIAAFMAGLVVAGTAPTMEVFLAGRFVQGLGGGLFNVALYVLVAQVYPAQAHPKVFSLLAAAWVLPSVVGPAITGVVAEQLSWRWVFLGVPMLAAPAVLVLWRGLPRQTAPPAETDANRDFAPALAWGAVAALGAALLQYGSGAAWPVSSLAIVGLVLLVVALPRLLPSGTLRAARGLPTVVALRGLAAGAFFATEVFVPLSLTTERGLSPAQAGVALTGGALAWSLGSWIQGRGKFGRAVVLRVGTALIAAGIAVTALAVFDGVPVFAAFMGWVLAGFGVGLVYPTLSVLVLELSAPGEEGRNSASLSIGESAFSIVAVAATGAIFAGFGGTVAVYLACFALLAAMAGTGAAIAGRFDHTR
ncbi:MFS transporter [Planotetraspora phitsanulokensis]|uniref:MFS transporter n=1 Tax=Planotetraspora phitsanulokensis TaxID=575192 RepID=A0A8J3UC34_9ACTN|nr:MFS transporter [Planotetraspora phitsanulokensis]GII42718.1 MFS transporter [Planotetraspora phitsanulokensis]